jgi:hypothetical protein
MKPRFEPRDEKFDAILKETKKVAERIEKRSSQPEYKTTEGSKVGPSMFVSETGGNTPIRSAHYNTNNSLIESEVVKNQGATSENSNVLDNTWSINEINRESGVVEPRTSVKKTLGTDGRQHQLDTIAKSVKRLSRHV